MNYFSLILGPIRPTRQLVEHAKEVPRCAQAARPPCSRVDFVEQGGGPLLIELELIDPFLYLGYAEGAPQRFAEADRGGDAPEVAFATSSASK